MILTKLNQRNDRLEAEEMTDRIRWTVVSHKLGGGGGRGGQGRGRGGG